VSLVMSHGGSRSSKLSATPFRVEMIIVASKMQEKGRVYKNFLIDFRVMMVSREILTEGNYSQAMETQPCPWSWEGKCVVEEMER